MDKGSHFITIKLSVHKRYYINNVYASNNRTSKYVKQNSIELQEKNAK